MNLTGYLLFISCVFLSFILSLLSTCSGIKFKNSGTIRHEINNRVDAIFKSCVIVLTYIHLRLTGKTEKEDIIAECVYQPTMIR